MGRRAELTEKLEVICSNVYFQPPSSVKLAYPCVIYSLEDLDPMHANNEVYGLHDQYYLLYITRDPEDDAVRAIASLPKCRMSKPYVADNLYHYPYRLYY